jgi:PAS domain S-box-containing protein
MAPRRGARQATGFEIKKLFDNILSSIPSGILVLDVATKVVYVNREAEQLFGTKAAQLVGRQLLLERRLAPIVRLINEHRKEVPPGDLSRHQIEEEIELPDGGFILLGFSIASLVDERRTVLGYVIVCRDLSEIAHLRERARRAEAMAALGTIAAGVAHEVRNPLHAIRAAVELAEAKAAGAPGPGQTGLEPYFETIASEIERADRIIEEVLDYSRKTKIDLKPVEVNRCVTQYLTLLEIPTGINIELDLMEGLPKVLADEFKLGQVLANLINNSKQAMQGKGRLRLATSLDPGPAGRQTHGLKVGYVRIDISDTGPGIAPEELPHLFDPYYTGKVRTGGTGLGLSICQKIVEDHEGFITVSSPPRLGAHFSVYLPVKPHVG